MRVTIIVARDLNGVIGAGGKLPWHLPEDLAHFKRVTMGHPILMGRRTWESIGRALPGRRNLVVSRDAGFSAAGAEVHPSPQAALAACAGAEEVFVIGGAQVYAALLGLTDRVILTEVHASLTGDTHFPKLDLHDWREISRQSYPAGKERVLGFDLVTLQRVRPSSMQAAAAA